MNELHDENGNFKKGHPKVGGRKKNSLSINDSVRKILASKDPKTKRKILDAIAQQIVTQAIKGNRDFNPTMMIQLWQQIDGKPSENLNIGNQDNKPFQEVVTFVFKDSDDNNEDT